ncbi:CRE_HP_G0038080.mRNA.1.CDS.1 [Saccharomyces cerevisiae]|nr:CRE_HP_G0038080.mRNA.1.CDS.1 [Saccharomyces cerevisiae]CAI6622860.1 CRE_HP_G0038080.mRNA.1.CDS.1 [Saccharomyces cerevisiae]
MPYSPSLILIWHTHTDATVYTISTYPTLTFHSMAHLSLNQYQMHSHHYARHLPQRSIPCAIYP